MLSSLDLAPPLEDTTVAKVKLKEVCPLIRGTPIDLGLSRKDSWKLERLRIGHTRLTHSFNFTGEEVPWCIEDEVAMTVKHILLDCGNLARERYKYYDPRGITLQTLLSEKDYVIPVLQFLKEIGWYEDI